MSAYDVVGAVLQRFVVFVSSRIPGSLWSGDGAVVSRLLPRRRTLCAMASNPEGSGLIRSARTRTGPCEPQIPDPRSIPSDSIPFDQAVVTGVRMQPVGIGEKLVFTGLAGMLLLALIVAGLSFEQSRRRQDRQRYPQVGQSVDIGGRTLNLYCSGEGRPTIVFDTFSHQAGLSWIAVQAQAAKFVRACWYDRAGYGWSDPGPLPRTFKAVATDLHALLKAAHVPPPYVLVGSHDAASNIRVYNGLYSSEVAGMVLIDANDVDVYAHHIDAPEFIKGPVDKYFGSFAPYMRESGCFLLPA